MTTPFRRAEPPEQEINVKKIKTLIAIAVLGLTAGACTPAQAIALIFPNEQATARRVAACESGGGSFENINIYAVSPTNDHGMFQINATTWNKPWHSDPVAQWIGDHWHLRYDPVVNAIMAKKIRQSQGWDAWTCY